MVTLGRTDMSANGSENQNVKLVTPSTSGVAGDLWILYPEIAEQYMKLLFFFFPLYL